MTRRRARIGLAVAHSRRRWCDPRSRLECHSSSWRAMCCITMPQTLMLRADEVIE
jgi:hypothetical protein